MKPTDPYASIAVRPIELALVSEEDVTETVLCECGHETPRRARFALASDRAVLPGATLVFDEERPEQCAECLSKNVKPRIALCGMCLRTIIPGDLVCIGTGAPNHPETATFVGDSSGRFGATFLICTTCSGSIVDLAGYWNGGGIHPIG